MLRVRKGNDQEYIQVHNSFLISYSIRAPVPIAPQDQNPLQYAIVLEYHDVPYNTSVNPLGDEVLLPICPSETLFALLETGVFECEGIAAVVGTLTAVYICLALLFCLVEFINLPMHEHESSVFCRLH